MSKKNNPGRTYGCVLIENCEPRFCLTGLDPAFTPTPSATLPAAYHAFDGMTFEDGHVSSSEFLELHPEYQGKNLWDPRVFNPGNSGSPNDWKYDAHLILDDRLRAHGEHKPARTASGSIEIASATTSTATQVLPDFYPTMPSTPFLDFTESAGRTLLRFSTQVNNQGLGPAILRGGPVNPNGTQQVFQRVYNYNASTNKLSPGYDRLAGNFTYHAEHGHIHFDGYARYRLFSNIGGRPGTQIVRPDGKLAEASKVGFCLINVSYAFTLPNGQDSSTLSTYFAQGLPETSCGQFQGILPGRADVYSSYLDSQWIDVTGVPNGKYFVEITLDARKGMLESNENNNVGYFPVTITGNGLGELTPDRFESNNTLATATNLGVTGTSDLTGLSIHSGGNWDWYKFTASSSTSAKLTLYFIDGDLDLFLYNSAGTRITSMASTGVATPTLSRTETLTASFTAGASYYVLVAGKTPSTVSHAYELQFRNPPTVSMTTRDNTADEAGNRGEFNITRNGPALTGLVVNFSVAGTATRGADYDLYYNNALVTGNSITIGADSNNAKIYVVPKVDRSTEAAESVVLKLAGSSTYQLGTSNNATVNIIDSANLTAPATPVMLGAQYSSGLGVSLSWSDVINETGYAVQWRYKTTGSPWNNLITTFANVTTYLDLQPARNATLEYRVKAVNYAGSSNWSNALTVVIPA